MVVSFALKWAERFFLFLQEIIECMPAKQVSQLSIRKTCERERGRKKPVHFILKLILDGKSDSEN